VLHRGSVIENGTAREIKSRVTGQVVRCRTKLRVEDLLRFEYVNDVRRDGDSVEIQTSSIDGVLRQLILTDPEAAGFELQKGGLEDAFLALTAK